MTLGATKIDGVKSNQLRCHLSCACVISMRNSYKTENSEVVQSVACWRMLHSTCAVKFSQADDVDMHFGIFTTYISK
jgi:hypothetical protein